MYGLRSNYPLYSASLSFAMFIFFLNLFHIFIYYFESNLCLVLLVCVAYKKTYHFFVVSKHEEFTLPHEFIFVFILCFIDAMGYPYMRVVYRSGSSNFLHKMTLSGSALTKLVIQNFLISACTN